MSNYPERENPLAASVVRQLREAGDSIRGGAFGEALEAIGHLRREMPKNIYCIGLEKQIQKLTLLPEGSQRQEILSSIPNLIDRAIDEARRSGKSRVPKNERRVSSASGTRAVALERLITQYFGHAERYFREGDYEKALVELRRVHIIDPDNRQAREFEDKLVGLIEAGREEEQPAPRRDEGTSSRKVEELLSRRDDVQSQKGFPAVPRDEESVSRKRREEVLPKRDEGRRKEEPSALRHHNESTSSKRLEELLSRRDEFPSGAKETFHVEQSEKANKTADNDVDEVFPPPENVISIPIITIVAVVAAFVVGYLLITVSSKPKSVPITSTEITELARSVASPDLPPPQRDAQKFAAGSVVHDSAARSTRGTITATTRTTERDTARSLPVPPLVTTTKKDIEIAPVIELHQELPALGAPPASSTTVKHDTTGFAAFRASSENLYRPPKVDVLSEPSYPDSALQNGLAGQVIVFVQLDANGHPLTARIYKSSHSVFEMPARRAALRSEYSAGATENGPVPSWIVVPFLFRPQSSTVSREE